MTNDSEQNAVLSLFGLMLNTVHHHVHHSYQHMVLHMKGVKHSHHHVSWDDVTLTIVNKIMNDDDDRYVNRDDDR
jgi:hypothetical protein